MKSVMERGNRFACVPSAADSDFVQAVTLRMITDRERKRESVFDDHRIAADIGFPAHAAKLMNARIRTDIGAVFNGDMAGQGRGIRHQHVVSDQAVVRDMRLGHQEAIVAEPGNAATAFGAAVDGDEFANPIAATDLGHGWFARKLQILWRQSYRNEWVQMSLVPDARPAVDHTMAVNPHAIAQNHLVTNDHVRADHTIAADLSAGANNCGRMNLTGGVLDRSTHFRTLDDRR